MECKYDWNIVTRYGTYELIDTLWNVNSLLAMAKNGKIPELIDTLWNVNMLLQPRTMLAGRINRYIMECKFLYVTIYSIGT